MFHYDRVWGVSDIADLDELVDKLSNYTWTGCTGFRWRSLLLLNDATSGDGGQEYAVVRDSRQVESLTVSWYKPDDVPNLKTTLQRLDEDPISYWEGERAYEQMTKEVNPNLDHPEGSCHLCA